MSTTTAEPVVNYDPRPLHIRLKEALQDDETRNKIAATSAAALGTVAGASVGYLGFVVSYAFLQSIGVPAFVLQVSFVSGWLSVLAYALWGGWMGWGIVRDK